MQHRIEGEEVFPTKYIYHVDTVALKNFIDYRGQNLTTLPVLLGMSRTTFHRKLQNQSFTISEIHEMCDILGMTGEQAKEIFLAE